MTSAVDAYTTLPGKAVKYVDVMPAAIALDMYSVKIVDLTGLIRLDELIKNARSECFQSVTLTINRFIIDVITHIRIR